MTNQQDRRLEQVSFDQLKQLHFIGAGSFGKVRLVCHNDDYMALKSIRKPSLERPDFTRGIINERKILYEMRDCTFIVHLYRTYRTEKYVHFLLELCVGGDAFAYSRSFKREKMPEENAKFITACIKEGLDYIHQRNYVFRDLKEENVLMDATGYWKLTDFGFCVRKGNLRRMVGTYSHLAPELIMGADYDHAVDLWAFGVTVFGLLTSNAPFTGPNRETMHRQISHGIRTATFPAHMTASQKSFIAALCRQNPKIRMGYKSVREVEHSIWLRDFDWKALRAKSMPSPMNAVTAEPQNVIFPVNQAALKELTFTDDKDDGPPTRNSGWDADF